MASWSQPMLELEPNVTTLALRGISKTHNRESILQLLDYASGGVLRVVRASRTYNFVYMPSQGRSGSHGGLAIVNFVDAEACHQCFLALRKMQEQCMLGVKSIGQSKIQGFAQNLAYYVVVSRDQGITDQPLIFVNGVTAGQEVLDYLITHCVTDTMKEQAAEQAEALYARKTPSPPGLVRPLPPGCVSRQDSTQAEQRVNLLEPGSPKDVADLLTLSEWLGCRTSDGMIVFSL